RVPITRAPKFPCTATISVPGAAAARAPAVTFSVTTADVLALTSSKRMRSPVNSSSGVGSREHGFEIDLVRRALRGVERALHVVEVLRHQRRRPLAIVRGDRVDEIAVLVVWA